MDNGIDHGTRKTQCARILALLERNPGEWVPLTAILGLNPRIAQYNTRIKELRDQLRPKGIAIECQEWWTGEHPNREKHSHYRLVRTVPRRKDAAQPFLPGAATSSEQR